MAEGDNPIGGDTLLDRGGEGILLPALGIAPAMLSVPLLLPVLLGGLIEATVEVGTATVSVLGGSDCASTDTLAADGGIGVGIGAVAGAAVPDPSTAEEPADDDPSCSSSKGRLDGVFSGVGVLLLGAGDCNRVSLLVLVGIADVRNADTAVLIFVVVVDWVDW